MKMKVTVLNPSRSLKLEVGESVKVVHDPSSKGFTFDPKVLAVFDEQKTRQIGTVGNKVGITVIAGTENNEKLFDEMAKRKLQENDEGYMSIDAKVVGDGKVQFKDGSLRTGFILEVNLPAIPVAPKSQNFELVVRGSVKEFKGKTTVLKELQQGNPVQLWLKKDGDKIITFLSDGNGNETLAGSVAKAEKGDLDRLGAYLDALSKRGTAQLVEPISAAGNAYSVKFDVDQQTFNDILSGKVIRTLDEVKKDIVSKGIVEKETLVQIEKYLKDNKVSTKQLKQVFETMRVYRDDVKHRIPNPDVKYKDTVGLVKKSIVYMNKGKFPRFIGEKGVGKNKLIETLAWIYQRPLFEMALNSQTDKMDILGSKTFESEVDDNGREVTRMDFAKEALIEAMEVGGIMNLDEPNVADPAVLVVTHPIADGRKRLEVPGYGLVEADENFSLILSMNQDYVGTNPLNEATRDRFVPIIFPNNPSIAKMLAVRVPDASPNDVTLADRVYGSIMKLVQDGQLTNDCITIRGFIDALEVVEDLGLLEALTDNVANRIEDEEYRNTVSSIIDDICG